MFFALYGASVCAVTLFYGSVKSPHSLMKDILLALGTLLVVPKVAPGEMPYAVDRDGRWPVPVITAREHCTWPNLQVLKDSRTLAERTFPKP